MTTPTPQITIELGCHSVLEWADLAPRLGPRGLFTTGPLRQLERDCGRRFDVTVAPFPLEKARWELEQAVMAHEYAMARSPVLADKLKSLLQAGDATDDVARIADLLREVKTLGANPFFILNAR
jgi:hypothetical protein